MGQWSKCSSILSSLPQPLGDNQWPINLTNKIFKTQFHHLCNYLLGFQTLALSYNKEMDQLVMANTINNEVDVEDISWSNDEEESEVQKTTYLQNTMIDSKEEHKTT
jgi:hypothetical protein